MNKTILKLLIITISTFIICYFAHKWNSYDVFILYFLIKLNVEKEMDK